VVPPRRRVTTADVARAAGVSRATVSYVLNNTPNRSISDATRTLVHDAARELRHVPHGPARTLRLGHSNTVLALIPQFRLGYIFEHALDELTKSLAERGYELLVHTRTDSERSINELWGQIAPAVVVAIGRLSSTELAEIEQDFPVVSIAKLVPDTDIGSKQAEYLIGRGHRHLAYALPEDPFLMQFAAGRLDGFRAVCHRHGLAEPAVESIDFTLESVHSVVRRWRALPEPPTAVGVHNDELALVLMAGLASLGLRAGEDLAVLGVDNIPMAGIGLTTVAISPQLTAQSAIAAVLAELGEPAPKADSSGLLDVIVRNSA
jgi:DNA-binding LacI/PurR family transcriptional regulator